MPMGYMFKYWSNSGNYTLKLNEQSQSVILQRKNSIYKLKE
jgi:hypothetical protein